MFEVDKFIPKNFNALSIEEKKLAINDLAQQIFKHLKLEPIPIVFAFKEKTDNSFLSGKFFLAQKAIFINEILLNNNVHIDLLEKKVTNYNNFLPYFIVHTLAHECYHYYQFSLIKELSNGVISKNDEVKASVNFISLFYNTFFSYIDNLDLDISISSLTDKELYMFSPTELEANNFSDQVTSSFIDKKENIGYDEFEDFRFDQNCNLLEYNMKKGGHLKEETIKHMLMTSVVFLNYKNETSGLKTPYLGIDVDKLKKTIENEINNCKAKEKKQLKNLGFLFKKQ